jgi:hypothetical protein
MPAITRGPFRASALPRRPLFRILLTFVTYFPSGVGVIVIVIGHGHSVLNEWPTAQSHSSSGQ